MVNHSSGSIPFKYNRPIESPSPSTSLTRWATHSPSAQTTRDSPSTQGPLKSFTLANPKPAYPVLPIPSYRNHRKGSWPHCPSFCLLTHPGAPCVAPRRWHALASWELGVTLAFQRQQSSDLLALLNLRFFYEYTVFSNI